MSIFNRTQPATTKKTTVKPKASAKASVVAQIGDEAPKAASTISRHGIIVAPLVTEKSARLVELHQYSFIVGRHANKIQITQAIKERYGVQAVSVNISNYAGKNVRVGRYKGARKDWKKAIVTVPADATLNVYEGV